MSLNEFRKLIRKFIEEELNEASVTANIDGGKVHLKLHMLFVKRKMKKKKVDFKTVI